MAYSNDTAQKKDDYYQEVTNDIIKAIEEGTAPWVQGWDDEVGQQLAPRPFNGASGRNYSKENMLRLLVAMKRRNSTDPRFYTFNQAKEQGFQIRKGSHGTTVKMVWKVEKDKDGNELPTEEQYWAKSYLRVFHATDCCLSQTYVKDEKGEQQYAPVYDEEGKPVLHKVIENGQEVMKPVLQAVMEFEPIPEYVPQTQGYTHAEICELAEAMLQSSGAKIFNDQADRAFYAPRKDEIHLPKQEAFPDITNYYATALHELAHWTGHESRLNRFGMGNATHGTPAYAKEELRAELASTFLSADLGLPLNTMNHAAYVDSWVAALKNDKMEIFSAANEAVKITHYLEGFIQDKLRQMEKAAQDRAQAEEQEKTVEAEAEPQPEAPQPAEGLVHSGQAGEPASVAKDGQAEVSATEATKSQPADQTEPKPEQPKAAQQPLYVAIHQLSDAPQLHLLRYASWQQAQEEQQTSKQPLNFGNYECRWQETRDLSEAKNLSSLLEKVYADHNQDNRTSGQAMHALSVSDVIQVNERYFYVDNTGFQELNLIPYKDKELMKPVSAEAVHNIISTEKQQVGDQNYSKYHQQFQQDYYEGSQNRQLDVKDGSHIDYRRFIFDNAVKYGLSSLHPLDQAGWEKADAAFLEKAAQASCEEKGYVDAADVGLAKMSVYKLSPRSAVVPDAAAYAKKIFDKVMASPYCREHPAPQPKEETNGLAR